VHYALGYTAATPLLRHDPPLICVAHTTTITPPKETVPPPSPPRLSCRPPQTPQILRLRDLMRRGIAVHHAGLLPIMKETVEMCFCQGYIKVCLCVCGGGGWT
jgi:hypothetical protein